MLKIFLRIIDFFLWVTIKVLPNKIIIKLIILSPWKIINLNLKNKKKLIIKNKLINFLRVYDFNEIKYSNCLSRSILCKIILDFLNIPNQLNFDINYGKHKQKILHAWLSDPNSGKLYTKGLNNKKNYNLITFI